MLWRRRARKLLLLEPSPLEIPKLSALRKKDIRRAESWFGAIQTRKESRSVDVVWIAYMPAMTMESVK